LFLSSRFSPITFRFSPLKFDPKMGAIDLSFLPTIASYDLTRRCVQFQFSSFNHISTKKINFLLEQTDTYFV